MPKTGRAIGFRAGGVASWPGAQNSCQQCALANANPLLVRQTDFTEGPRSTATFSRREPLQGVNSSLPESCVGFLSLRKVLKSLTDINFLSRISGGAKGKAAIEFYFIVPNPAYGLSFEKTEELYYRAYRNRRPR
jgi:hypothetical protein